MFKTISLIISVIINIVLLSFAFYYYDTNRLKVPQFYLKNLSYFAPQFERGTPIDRFYIESFLEKYKDYIKGNILDMQSDNYAQRFGHDVESIDVMDFSDRNENATLIGDLQNTDEMPEEKFDSFILTQTLQYPYDTKAVMKSIYKMLKKDGAVLITAPVISQMSNEDDLFQESWRFTKYSLRRLLEEAGFEVIDVLNYGNPISSVLFIEGFAVEDLKDAGDLEYIDDWCPMLVAAIAVKR